MHDPFMSLIFTLHHITKHNIQCSYFFLICNLNENMDFVVWVPSRFNGTKQIYK